MKRIDGAAFYTPADYEPVPQWWFAFEDWWERWGRAFLVAAVLVQSVVWWQLLAPPTYTWEEMQDFAVLYLNNVR